MLSSDKRFGEFSVGDRYIIRDKSLWMIFCPHSPFYRNVHLIWCPFGACLSYILRINWIHIYFATVSASPNRRTSPWLCVEAGPKFIKKPPIVYNVWTHHSLQHQPHTFWTEIKRIYSEKMCCCCCCCSDTWAATKVSQKYTASARNGQLDRQTLWISNFSKYNEIWDTHT